MNAYTAAISNIFKGGGRAFRHYPAALVSALGFALVTMIRIQLDWPQQEPYNLLFSSLHWSFALGSIFSLAAITAAQSRLNTVRAFIGANLAGLAVVAVTFAALYSFGASAQGLAGSRYEMVSGIAAARVLMAILISYIAFVYLAGYPEREDSFSRSFFMSHKAFIIAFVYGWALMIGFSGVAGAIQALLYHGMSEKVYMYIATLAGFMAFAIFVGYFPDFRRGEPVEHREIAEKQPRFVEILFGNILIPIVLALTIVLLLWAGKTLIGGEGYSFYELSGIAAAYAIGGIWLHVLVTQYESGLARFYRRTYPLAALVILAFEAWALVVQLQKTGLKTDEYYFAGIWIIAVTASVLLLIKKARAHTPVAVFICVLAVFSVLPVVGYQALPVAAQVSRLETVLYSEGMLDGDQLKPAPKEPELAVRETITDAVMFLANAEDARLPAWFDPRLGDSGVFEEKLGFKPVYAQPEPEGTMERSLVLMPEAMDISDYRWAVNMQNLSDEKNGETVVNIQGERGLYRISWRVSTPDRVPVLAVRLDDRLILEQDMNPYIDRITASYPPGQAMPYRASMADLSMPLETPEISVLLVFSNVDIYVDPRADIFNYGLNLSAMYVRENPR